MADSKTNTEAESTTKTKPPPSDAKIRANRENCKKSTGPKTLEGKKRASKNSTIHGLCAKASALIEGEDEEAYAQRKADWIAEHKPRTPTELFLVEDMVDITWRLDRCKRFDAARLSKAIRDSLDAHDCSTAEAVDALVARLKDDPHPVGAARRLRSSLPGLNHLHARFTWLIGAMFQRGCWLTSERHEVFRLFGLRPEDYYDCPLGVDLFDLNATAAWTADPHDFLNWDQIGGVKLPPSGIDWREHEWRLKEKVPTPFRTDESGKKSDLSSYEKNVERFFARCEIGAMLRDELARIESRRAVLRKSHVVDRLDSATRAACDLSPGGQVLMRYEASLRRFFHVTHGKLQAIQANPDREGDVLFPTEPTPGVDFTLISETPESDPLLSPDPGCREGEYRVFSVPPNGATELIYDGPKWLPRIRFRDISFHPRTLRKQQVPVIFREAWMVSGLSSASEWSSTTPAPPCVMDPTPEWMPRE